MSVTIREIPSDLWAEIVNQADLETAGWELPDVVGPGVGTPDTERVAYWLEHRGPFYVYAVSPDVDIGSPRRVATARSLTRKRRPLIVASVGALTAADPDETIIVEPDVYPDIVSTATGTFVIARKGSVHHAPDWVRVIEYQGDRRPRIFP